MKLKSNKTKEIAICLSLILFSLFVIFYLSPFHIEAEKAEILALSPRLFPELASWLIAFLSTVLILITILEDERNRHPKKTFNTFAEEMTVLAASAISIFFIVSFILLGFIPATFVSLVLLNLTQGKLGIIKNLGISMITTLSVYLFFHYVMEVFFPVGELLK